MSILASFSVVSKQFFKQNRAFRESDMLNAIKFPGAHDRAGIMRLMMVVVCDPRIIGNDSEYLWYCPIKGVALNIAPCRDVAAPRATSWSIAIYI